MKKVLILLFWIFSVASAPAQYSWITYPNANDYASGIKTFFFEDETTIWGGSVFQGIFLFSHGQYVNYSEANSDIAGNIVNKILLDQNNTKWIATNKGLSILTADYFETFTAENSSIPSNQINDIAMAPGGRLWIATQEGVSEGLYGKSHNTGNSPLPENSVYTVFIDKQGIAWFGTGKGLATYDGSQWDSHPSGPKSFPDGPINFIHEDNEGNIWISVANEIDGFLVKYDGAEWIIMDESAGYFVTARITSIVNDTSGNMWFGTHHQGLVRFDGNDWEIYNTDNSDLPLNQIMSLGLSPAGQVWYGARDGFVKMEMVLKNHYGRPESDELVIYPNPFRETVRISIPGSSGGPYQLCIYDCFGREFLRMSDLANQQITISKQQLPSGMYIVRVSGQNKTYTSKIISR